MFIEDLLQKLFYSHKPLSIFDTQILRSLCTQLNEGKPFTEKQGNLAIITLKKYKKSLANIVDDTVYNFLENPQFKYKFRILSHDRKINIIDNHAFFGRAITVTFPYNEELIEKFRKEKNNLKNFTWDGNEKIWICPLHELNIMFLMKLIKDFNFIADAEFLDYANQIENIIDNLEHYTSIIKKQDDKYMLTNKHLSVNTFLSFDLFESLFIARKNGFYIWDDVIDNELTTYTDELVTTNFLKSSTDKSFILDLEKNNLVELKSIIKNLLPCLVIIPGGNEYYILKNVVNMLLSIGFSNRELSVMFRLSNETDKHFNEFIKELKLNNPISSTTKVVFISNNIPKPVIEQKINFNLLLNFNTLSPHYKLRDYIIDHHNVIHIHNRKYSYDIM